MKENEICFIWLKELRKVLEGQQKKKMSINVDEED